ncbi:MAG TPA: type I-C CRISPR-associated protein Cas8c/Csd1 [Arachnia sp.]|nr:type I-C CRISPR-associated protein Cas8c/Csd1 [Arachnia sp.]HMT86551.1 type I-C CRISPR-associated protein Cas8c/Csd1 [Arachnia sp.]
MRTLFSHLVIFSREHGKALAYHAEATFLWELVLNTDGTPRSTTLAPLTTPQTDPQRAARPGRTVTAPRMTRTRGILPMVGSDDIAYVLGWVTPPDPKASVSEEKRLRAIEDAANRHAAFCALHRAWAACADAELDPVPRAVVQFLEHHVDKIEQPDSFTSKDGVLIRVGSDLAVEASTAASFWAQHVRRIKGSGRTGICLTCGRHAPLADTLPQVVKSRHVPGGQSSGVAPISINEKVYGYGLKDGLGQVPLCEECARAIPDALNTLLESDEHRHKTPESVHVWWLEGKYEKELIELDVPPDASTVRHLAESPDVGRPAAQQTNLAEFHSLTMTGNSARLVIKEWFHRPVQEIQHNVARWFQDTQLPEAQGGNAQFAPLWLLAASTGRYDSTRKRYMTPATPGGGHPHGITDTLRSAALSNSAIPMTVATHLVQRVAADQIVDTIRAALLRCYLIRSAHTKEGPMPGLDPNHPSAAYQLGRLLSVYSDVQYSSARLDGGQVPNSTFADKYLAGAITSPRLVLTAGAKQSSAWLTKLRRARKNHFAERRIDEIVSRLDSNDPGPVRATIDEQALFILGYQHQGAHDRNERDLATQRRAEADSSTPDTSDR